MPYHCWVLNKKLKDYVGQPQSALRASELGISESLWNTATGKQKVVPSRYLIEKSLGLILTVSLQ